MTTHLEIRRGQYHDSVSLMQVSRAAQEVPGVEAALVAMATDLNRDFLEPMGFDPDVDAGPNDLLVALRARDEEALAAGLAAVEGALTARSSSRDGGFGEAAPPRTTAAAVARVDGVNLVLVSTPGANAFVEAMDALRGGASVMIFSDNVPVEQEVILKQEADARGLLVMGPDCGTAMIGGIGLGFANVVRPGHVGVVAASGTGAQQLTCLLDEAGVGISHVLGVGGRDLKELVGGRSTLAALRLLDADPATELIVVLSKPPAETVAARVREAARSLDTPVVLGLLGVDQPDLTQLAKQVVQQLGSTELATTFGTGQMTEDPPRWMPEAARTPRQGRLLGLFAGGTLAMEAMVVASPSLGPIRSNVPLRPEWSLDSHSAGDAGTGHEIVDLGEDEFTRGRPHPMIDQALRLDRIAALDDDVAVLLLDVVLGHAAHPDPTSELAPALAAVRARTGAHVVVSLCGTASDPQDRRRQVDALIEAGASVHSSNADAAREAVRLIAEATS